MQEKDRMKRRERESVSLHLELQVKTYTVFEAKYLGSIRYNTVSDVNTFPS